MKRILSVLLILAMCLALCACGTNNMGKFCTNCGTKKPSGVPQYKCDKCGWQPADPSKAPRFCPECGDPFDGGDLI